MLIASLSLITLGIVGHLYFGTKYREFFLVDKDSMNRSLWQMITNLKQKHPVAANAYIGFCCASFVGVAMLVALQINSG